MPRHIKKEISKVLTEKKDIIDNLKGKTISKEEFYKIFEFNPSSPPGKIIQKQVDIKVETKKEEKMKDNKEEKVVLSEEELERERLKARILLEEQGKLLEEKRKTEEEVKKKELEIEQKVIQDLAGFCLLHPDDPRCKEIKTKDDFKKLMIEMTEITPKKRGEIFREIISEAPPEKIVSIMDETYEKNPEQVKNILSTLCKDGKCFQDFVKETTKPEEEKEPEKKPEEESKSPFDR